MSDYRARAVSILNGATGGLDSWSKWDRDVFDVVDAAADDIERLRSQVEGMRKFLSNGAFQARAIIRNSKGPRERRAGISFEEFCQAASKTLSSTDSRP